MHVILNTCWRCYSKKVEAEDELGLCEVCLDILRDPHFAKL